MNLLLVRVGALRVSEPRQADGGCDLLARVYGTIDAPLSTPLSLAAALLADAAATALWCLTMGGRLLTSRAFALGGIVRPELVVPLRREPFSRHHRQPDLPGLAEVIARALRVPKQTQ